MTIFDCLKDIISVKGGRLDELPEFDKAFNVFMLCRYLSMDERFVDVATEANRLQGTLTQRQMYRYLLKRIPRQRNSYIKYIAKRKTK